MKHVSLPESEQRRVSSPDFGASTLMTSAPMSAMSMVADGPARMRDKSKMRRPARGPLGGADKEKQRIVSRCTEPLCRKSFIMAPGKMLKQGFEDGCEQAIHYMREVHPASLYLRKDIMASLPPASSTIGSRGLCSKAHSRLQG